MTAAATLSHWADLCRASARAENLLRVDGTLYCIAAHPRPLANGAITGRVHAHGRGHGFLDVGAFKIVADGQVVTMPEPLREILTAAPILDQGTA